MKPYVWPSSDEAPPVSARRTFPRQFRANHGTLNLFSATKADPTDHHTSPTSDDLKRSSSSPITGQRSLRYCNHNRESTATREFPTNRLRHVTLPLRSEAPHGIRHVHGAAGAGQNVQVVNITAAYKDPAQMGPLKTGVRCTPRKGSSSEVEAALAYTGTCQQLSARVLKTPVGKAAQASPFTVDYTPQERFAQSVRDHAQRRSRGVAEFFVHLVRNAVGGVTSSTPKPVVVPWSLEGGQPRRVLTLGRCCDQLVALTAIPISLEDFAALLWGPSAERVNRDIEGGEALSLEDTVVPFRDFAAAFGQNSSDGRLAQIKI
ncbi:hypothetical protein ABL78_1963 [Leptomonas seymouri]|uniref:Uncharacterized protein n=1 Tax=Leptomonas seymouri TaxID=5684 RepID=A0A0N1I1G9_LEPSE|nr:hypothetical protein ABL78_1963 [Leptomonas seymouri]|eukprot:KPI88918.1 hypothetical protein ABL78_1963 [Leptomonas seymouri]